MANAVKGLTTGVLVIGQAGLQFSGNAWQGLLSKSSPGTGRTSARLSAIICNKEPEVFGAEDFTHGNPAQPSLRLDSKGSWRFRWALSIGQHTIAINVMHTINQNPRPSMVIKANPAIGINSDVETFAPSSPTWTMIGPVSVNITSTGATWVELRNNLETNVGMFPAFFDHVVKT